MGVVLFPSFPFMGVMLFPCFVIENASGESRVLLVPLSPFSPLLSLSFLSSPSLSFSHSLFLSFSVSLLFPSIFPFLSHSLFLFLETFPVFEGTACTDFF